MESKADKGNGITPIAYDQGREIAALQESVRALCRSVDDLRDEVHGMRDVMATKEDLKSVTACCTQCPTIDKRIGRIEQSLYGADDEDVGLVGRFNTTEGQVGKLRVRIYGIGAAATAIGVIIGYVITWVTGSK